MATKKTPRDDAETLDIAGREVRVTHPDKPYFSRDVKLTKLELVRYYLEDIEFKGAWTSPAALELHPHVMANVAGLPVRQVVRALHYKADLTLGVGEVVFDYLAEAGAHVGGDGRAQPATTPMHQPHEGTAGA